MKTGVQTDGLVFSNIGRFVIKIFLISWYLFIYCNNAFFGSPNLAGVLNSVSALAFSGSTDETLHYRGKKLSLITSLRDCLREEVFFFCTRRGVKPPNKRDLSVSL
jgi:hypothetical protein